MSEHKGRIKRFGIPALVAVVALLAALLFRGKLFSVCTASRTEADARTSNESGERKILYWYDAMNPQKHYNRPGKSPDGMDLVPKYGDEETSTAASAATPNDGLTEEPKVRNTNGKVDRRERNGCDNSRSKKIEGGAQ